MAFKGKPAAKKAPAKKSSGGTWDPPDAFERANEEARPRLLVMVKAREKRGKTNFALTAPGPIAILHSDMGLEGVIQKFQSEKEIYVANFGTDFDAKETEKVKQAAVGEWDRYVDTYTESLERKVRTLVLDTWTEGWELARLAEFGKLTQVKPHHYGPLNAKARRLFKLGMSHDSNVIFLCRMKEAYEDDKATGEYRASGFKDTPYEVHVVVGLDRDEDGEFTLEIEDCRHNPEANGMVLKGDACTFQQVAGLVMPDVDAAVWE